MQEINDLLTVNDVAKKLKVTPQYVRKLISDSKLEAVRIGSQWVVSPNDLSRYIKEFDVCIEPDDHQRKS